MTMHGKIKKVMRDFGFITPDGGGADVFFHHSSVPPDTFARLSPGQQVAFEVRTDKKGRTEAINLIIEFAQNSPQPMVVERPASIAPNIAGTELEQPLPPAGYGEPPPLPSQRNLPQPYPSAASPVQRLNPTTPPPIRQRASSPTAAPVRKPEGLDAYFFKQPRRAGDYLYCWTAVFANALEDLANLALRETWEFGGVHDPQRPFPILESYLR